MRPYTITIDALEKETGLDFNAHLDDNAEAALESALPSNAWAKFYLHSRKPGRYTKDL